MGGIPERLKAAFAGHYEIERELGAGGMATVYLARDVKHDRSVAIKVLRPELAAALGPDRFPREIRIVAKLSHPHILPLYDSGEVDGFLYFVMPHVEGESLRAKLQREGQLPIQEIVRVLRDVVDGLAYAHSHGVVHRDIKPDNVMLSGRHATVMDFGVAKAVSAAGGQKLTTVGMALGTPTYMSPEQAMGEADLDHRTDIYAIGILAYEMLTGTPPFDGTTAQAVLSAQVMEKPADISQQRPGVPPALASLVMQCLEKKQADRWQSADEMLSQLEVLGTPSGGLTPTDTRPVSVMPSHSASRRHWWIGSVTAALAITIFVVVQQSHVRSIRTLATELQAAADSGKLDEIHTTLQRTGVSLSARGLEEVALMVSGTLDLETDPAGASVRLARALRPLDSIVEWIEVGSSPVRGLAVVAGEYIASFELDRHETVEIAVSVPQGDTVKLRRSLVNESWDASDMVLVERGHVTGPQGQNFAGVEVSAFLMDRYEVSNEMFMRFVVDGGYRNSSLWPDSLVIDGQRTPRDVAVAGFADRTGLPGPRNWSGGTFPENHSLHPVTAVTWYEASAYAEWAGKALPTLEQWWRAALGDSDNPFPWGNDLSTLDDRSNFSMIGTAPVNRHAFGISPYGAYDMAGNVREWLQGGVPDVQYPAVGGSWQDPTYMFSTPNTETFAPWFQSDAVGFRLVKPVPDR